MGKQKFFAFLFLTIIWTLPSRLPAEEVKKKILVLCSNGGYCHNAAAQTLKNLLSDRYSFEVVYPIDELKIWGISSGEGLYNYMLQHGWVQSINLVTKHLAPKIFRTRKSKLETLIKRHIERTQADLVISVIPFVNCPATEAARKCGVPYLLITLDNDLQMWVHGLQGVQHPHFKVTVASDSWNNREMLRKRKIPDCSIAPIGLPIRADFFSDKNVLSIKNDFNIPPNKPVVLIICGGAGGKQAFEYAKEIGLTQFGVHLVVCAGKNQDLPDALHKLSLHPTNSMTVVGFTSRISDLMAASDLIITKSGPATVTEAMAMRLPILIDATSPILSWEQSNIDLVMHYGIGDYISAFEEVDPLLRRFVFDSELRKEIKDSYRKVPVNCFRESIGPLVDSMCALKEEQAR